MPVSREHTQEIIIIGGGIGGLATAIRLAAQGRRVRVLEKNERVGGKLNLIERDGFTFDTGPSLITMPGVLRDLFASARKNLDDYLTLLPLEPVCRYFYPDGVIFDASNSLPHMLAAIEQLNPKEVTPFLRFLAYCSGIYDVAAEPFLLNPLSSFRDLLGLKIWREGCKVSDLAKVGTLKTVDGVVRRFFRDPHLRQLFNRYATYNGSSPYKSPAAFCIIPFVEYATGAWYIEGGIYTLVRALNRLALELGVEISTNAEVREILIEQGRASGVLLTGGQRVGATLVVANADTISTYKNLIPPRYRKQYTDARLDALEPSCSGFVLLLGVDTQYHQLRHHNIFFSANYPEEFEAIFQHTLPPRDPTIYICATSKSDPTQAPAGNENLFILVNAPSLSGKVDWNQYKQGYRDLILAKLENAGLTNLRHHITVEEMITPQDLATRYAAHRGAIYGLSSNRINSAFLRPRNRARDITGLYFVGGSTHPGGGIPLVTLSGKIVADLIAKEYPLSTLHYMKE